MFIDRIRGLISFIDFHWVKTGRRWQWRQKEAFAPEQIEQIKQIEQIAQMLQIAQIEEFEDDIERLLTVIGTYRAERAKVC